MSEQDEPVEPEVTSADLDEDWRDQLVAITKGGTSIIPLIGGVIGEVVGATIPRQRVDRIASYLRQLSERIEALDADVRASILGNAEKVDLIEEGGFQAARATSPERITRIAQAVRNGLTSDEAEAVRRKRILVMLGELDDDELTLLNAYRQSYGGGDQNIWDTVNRPDPAHLRSSRADIDSEKLYQAGKEHLLRLGLLKKNYKKAREISSWNLMRRRGTSHIT